MLDSSSLALVTFGALAFIALFVGLAFRSVSSRASAAQQALDQRIEALARQQAELAGHMQAVARSLGERQGEMQRVVTERLDSVTHRLGQTLLDSTRHTGETLSRLNERLATLDAARASLGALATEVGGLKSILSDKQARGAFGQARMEAIVADGLPETAYEFQPTLSNGKRPDCLIRLPNTPEGLVVDAKFPLEAVTAWREAQTAEEKKAAAQRLRVDISRHVEDIAQKYLVPGETQDIALMFVPSESIHAELHEAFDDVVQKAFRARIVLVSPSLLMMAIQVARSLVRDARMREEARLVQIEVGHLLEDVRRLGERGLALEKHFAQAVEDVGKLLVSADKIVKRGTRIGAMDLADGPAPAPALSPAAE